MGRFGIVEDGGPEPFAELSGGKAALCLGQLGFGFAELDLVEDPA